MLCPAGVPGTEMSLLFEFSDNRPASSHGLRAEVPYSVAAKEMSSKGQQGRCY